MTIDFICEELAELFDSPCNYSPMDEKMFQDSYCESHCGKITDKECWKRYFEKVWADRKTEPIPHDDYVEWGNDHIKRNACTLELFDNDGVYIEPQTEYRRVGQAIDSVTGKVLGETYDVPQTDCSWQNDEHIPTDLASTMLKERFKEQK